MSSGYYDYNELGAALVSIIQHRQDILEIGIGTGLIAEKLLKLNPEYHITGVDFTHEMLDIAKQRCENQVRLIEKNILDLDLGSRFDVILSNGGI